MTRRALNQKTARDLPFEAFLDLAADLGCVGVEPRNDLGRPFFDGADPAVAAEMARARGLRLLGLSEVYGFNVWDDERATQIQELIDVAVACGAETISLIPTVDDRPTRDLRDVMRDILPMVQGTGVVPLIEPIGFESSSIRGKADLVEAIEAVGGFKLVHDTFQHAIAGETEIFPQHTGIVHISGISNAEVPLDAAQDGHRILVDFEDRCDNMGQVCRFIEAGYSGTFSFELTEPNLIWAPNRDSIESSFKLLSI
ncbi:TIM barrel protein [Maritimibacter dapengensis]|uniref:TIM barrel protein n=1 Tax=Maritimibacter dapengensis TaxID=2836868 RepID=A0ABS6T6E3_9RHOB|nr:TIM barrel protein [Maritimibacter dapengensis]MBV7380268.1 TIM barrel protein [Maritimibacter dapengensis]